MRLLLSLVALPIVLAAPDIKSKLVSLAAAGNGVIRLDADTFDLLTTDTRDWSVSVQLTALDPRRRCMPCKEFNPSWNAVAKAWTKVTPAERDNHFFATLDFDEGPAVFQKLGLTSAPVVYNFAATTGPRASNKAPARYDFSHGFEAEPLAEHLSNHTPVPIPYSPPFDWARWITAAAGLLTAAVTLRFIAPILQNKWTWAAGTIITALVMTSGYMFTRIRGAPYVGQDGSWIAGGYQNQFGQEVQVIAVVYGTLGFAFLMLTMVIPNQSTGQRQRVQVYLWTTIITLVYSILIVLFKAKNRGYPFRLLL
ncbi:hypothetical protein MKEN_01204100 [Mycena kentingensis (nom. inval.)]|nr:hypothetical protein MKEN_01204100 [Mycena kentingensis (nom. inval.)]